MKADLYHHEAKYNNWKKNTKKKKYVEYGLTENKTEHNSRLFLDYIFDMELGANVCIKNKRGGRSFARLNTLRTRLSQLFRMFQERGIKDITKITENQVQSLFLEMRNGTIKNNKGEKYKTTYDYVKTFKAFWHWWMVVNRKKGQAIQDITIDLDSSPDEKPKWVYVSEREMTRLLNECDARYKPLLSFLYDSGARVTETFSLLVQDLHIEDGIIFVDIKDEYAKTFGRKIKLLMCGKDLIEYIKRSELKPQDKLFSLSADYTNHYLKELGKKLFGEGVSKAGALYSQLSLYDFRHNSCCYWLKRYKNNSGLMYRFGWKSEKYILYYSEFLGYRDLIKAEDLFSDISKSEIEKELQTLKESMEKIKVSGKVIDKSIAKNPTFKDIMKKTIREMLLSGEIKI